MGVNSELSVQEMTIPTQKWSVRAATCAAASESENLPGLLADNGCSISSNALLHGLMTLTKLGLHNTATSITDMADFHISTPALGGGKKGSQRQQVKC